MKKYLNNKIVLMILITLLIIIFIFNDYFLYKTPILKINRIDTTEEQYGSYNEKYYNQKISGYIMNGKYKGKKITVTNVSSTSGVNDEKIHKHSELFVNINDDNNSIIGIKRDKYIAILLVLFIDMIIIISGKKGVKTLISLLVNVIISALAIYVFQSNAERFNLLLLYIIVSIIYIITSLLITNKRSPKTYTAIVCSIISLFTSFGLSYLVIHLCGRDVSIWTMEYIEYVRDYENYFYVYILLSGLGAIMDISITIASSLNELIDNNFKISRKDLLNSGKEISKDIVGTMSNVMLFTCFTPIIPITFLAIKNNMPLLRAIASYGEIELTIVLCSCISIIIAIPISLYLSVYLLKKYKKEVIK